MMYKSPIDIIYGKIKMDVDNAIFSAIQNVHINVDREELIKALQYDRGQYEKGYDDGCKNVAKEIYDEIGDSDILVVETQEYGEIEVVPIERLKEIVKSKGVEVE